MSLYKRQDIPKLLSTIEQGNISQVYLLFGERYLCRSAVQEIIDCLLPDQERQATSLQHIDGDQEDPAKTLNLLRTYSLFPGRQIFWVTDSKLFFSKGIAKSIWDKVCKKKEANEKKHARRYLKQMLDLAAVSPAEMLDEDITSLSSTRWKNLFGFVKPKGDLSWVLELLTGNQEDNEPTRDVGPADTISLYTSAFEAGIPPDNILILLAETVDKRKRFYKFIQENGVVVNLSVESGGSAAAKRDQDSVLKDLVVKTLAGFDKKIDPQAIPVLLERVGFHPVAAVMESEKLAHYAGDRQAISKADVDAIIGRTREEALYELNEAVTGGRLEESLTILARLQEGGVHPLAILATLKNHMKKLLLVRSLQDMDDPKYFKSIAFPAFQKSYLPKLKDGRDEWSTMLWKSHPYGLYMLFRQAAQFTYQELENSLKELLKAEFRLKSSSVDNRLIIDSLLFNILHNSLSETHAT
jgi:DNA polymerase-3 subunit delta